MKVKDLIKELSEFDPEVEVSITDELYSYRNYRLVWYPKKSTKVEAERVHLVSIYTND